MIAGAAHDSVGARGVGVVRNRMRHSRPSIVTALVAIVLLLLGMAPLLPTAASAITTPQSTLTADWLAAQVNTDGSVSIPGETFGVTNQTVFVALGLASTGQHRDALARAMGWIGTHVTDWVVDTDGSGSTVGPVGADLPGRLGQLLVLAHATGADPRAFGTPATDLVARLQALFGAGGTPGFYGWPDPTSAVQDQSAAILGLVASGATVPATAVQWLVDQQCPASGPAGTEGGWMALRSSTGGVPDPCDAPDPVMYAGVDTNSTALAMQALIATGTTGPVTAGISFLHGAQSATGGFPWFAGGDPDPNSTALVIQAIVAAGQDPGGAAWTLGGGTPVSVLLTWQLGAPDAGAFEYPYPGMYGVPNLYATYQASWGLTRVPFPFPALEPWPPVTTTVPVEPTEVVPAFTG